MVQILGNFDHFWVIYSHFSLIFWPLIIKTNSVKTIRDSPRYFIYCRKAIQILYVMESKSKRSENKGSIPIRGSLYFITLCYSWKLDYFFWPRVEIQRENPLHLLYVITLNYTWKITNLIALASRWNLYLNLTQAPSTLSSIICQAPDCMASTRTG